MKKTLVIMAIILTSCTYTHKHEKLNNGLILIAEQDGCKLYYTLHEGATIYWSICNADHTTTTIAVTP